ncbi:MAG: hypothetical protein WC840_03310 [Candidatus Peribacteraceae bacterium]
MEERIEQLISAVRAIEERNLRVEAEKTWETSAFRVGTIALTTYIVAAFVLVSMGAARPYLNALIPTVGFVLSMQSLPFVKRWWIARHRRKKL